MATITKIEASLVQIPLKNVTSLSVRAVYNREYVLVRATDENGVIGIGFCYAGHRCGQLVQWTVIDLLAPIVGATQLANNGIVV